MNKFEQLIEYVINDEDAKARELFHDIVVEKSRQIYEEMMQEEAEEVDEAEDHDEEEKDKMEEGMHDMDETAMGGDQADDLIDDVEAEETGISMEAEEDEDDHHDDVGGDEELEDRVVDLEDKLDELMAEFEELMGGGDAGEVDMDDTADMGGDDIDVDMDSEEVVDDEFETEGMMENVDLKSAPKPVTSEEGGINKKAVVAANSGSRGAVAKPVKEVGGEENGRPAPKAQDMGGTTKPNVKPAVKPHLAQATGVNTKSVVQ
jgi:hypothetical protein